MKFVLALIYTLSITILPGDQCLHSSESSSGDLVISIKNLKNTQGKVGILLFNREDGFPTDSEQAIRDVLTPIEGINMTYTFPDLTFGEYAVAVMHDENDNGKLDTNLFGIPREGNGVSNNVVGKLGPPRFQKAAFQFRKNNQSVEIELRY
jgi:uncharacterized protein (DUF2141 family)